MVILTILAGVAAWVLLTLPAVSQDEQYHSFADQRTIWGIPNFWNAISNGAFLAAAVFAAGSLGSSHAFTHRWERVAYGVLIGGVGLTAFGSGYYHLHPNTQTLFWDRLPMTLVFMSLLAATIGERIGMKFGRVFFIPLLIVGALSVVYWRTSGDLRFYGLVQFIPMIAIPAMLLLFPPYYSNGGGVWAMLGLYLLAKILELFDTKIGAVIDTGGHPWKHVAGAAAIVCYGVAIARRRRLP